MDSETFFTLSGARWKKCDSLMKQRSDQYSRNEDKLHNFKRAAGFLGCTPEKALLGMMSKHVISVLDIIDDIDKGILPSDELIDEKFSDLHNYEVLLEAIIVERKKEENKADESQ